ncbi:TetR/AcrR family transcriptional regulator [Enterococcus sp. AZ196]|uniref:TetR/AcrR family transcriptional regulator n=1 Tax=Enterococcus sp. AZ196 TaxID=2774659 RepID=UPI003D2C5D6B
MNKNLVKKSILDAFLELLTVSKYEDITVNEIVENAYVSRVTFYNYFKNKDALLDELLDQFLKNFNKLQKSDLHLLEKMTITQKKDTYQGLYPYTYKILDFFYCNKKLVRAFYNMNHEKLDFMQILQKNYHDHFSQALPRPFYKALEASRIEYYSLFMTNGVVSIIEKWFASNFEGDIADVADKILVLLITNLSALYSELDSR